MADETAPVEEAPAEPTPTDAPADGVSPEPADHADATNEEPFPDASTTAEEIPPAKNESPGQPVFVGYTVPETLEDIQLEDASYTSGTGEVADTATDEPSEVAPEAPAEES